MWAIDERGMAWVAGRALAAAAACCVVMAPAGARCVDEDQLVEEFASSAAFKPAAETPRQQLQAMVRDALQRSAAVGASRLLADAALKDLEETAAGRQPSANFTGTLGLAGAMAGSVTQYNGVRALGTMSAGAPLIDNGRQDKLQEWRTQLADAARAGEITAQEQVVLQTVSLALERNRYRVQMAVYQQYARKTACLVEALEQITQADKGRASELVQARKTHEQVRISLEQAQSQMRQNEARLRRFVGPNLPAGEGLASVLVSIPSVEQIQEEASRASEIAQLNAQAKALTSYSEAVQAGQKTQLGWTAQATKGVGAGDGSTNWLVGLNITVPLLNAGADPAAQAAAKRAEAARMQWSDALEARKSRAVDVNEQAVAAFDRSRRYSTVLRDSDRLRGYTLQQWQQLGKRSLFDVMAAEGDHYNTRVAYVNALHDGLQANALLWSLGRGLGAWLQ